jgi:oxygen-independent coproporphyrinogen-3 oxidase
MVMLRLRTADGLDLGLLEGRFGAAARQAVQRSLGGFAGQGLVLGCGADGRRLEAGEGLGSAARVRLSDPEGFLVSNDVISDVFAALGDVGAAAAAAAAAEA